MSYYVLTCNGYKVERENIPTLREAIAECIELERVANDGYVRVVTLDGQIVADAEGSHSDPERGMDAATQTGMYDAW
jgi:hypothetical protein